MADILEKLAQEMGFKNLEEMTILVNQLKASITEEEFDDWKRNHQSKETLLYLLEKDKIVSQ